MKIYVVTEGYYSDYCIDRIFLDRKKANQYCIIQNSTNPFDPNYRVEEYDTVDDETEIIAEAPRKAYRIVIDVFGKINSKADDSCPVYRCNFKPEVVFNKRDCTFNVTCIADSYEQALKKAQDMITEYKEKMAGVSI